MHSLKRLSRFFASLALVALLLQISQTGVSYAFSDVRTGTPYQHAIEALEERGVVEGYTDGTFKAENEINRAEFLKIVLGARGKLTRDDPFRSFNCFLDVPEGEWFAEDICLAKDDGIVAGYPDGLFHPERTINFVEASKILSIAFGQTLDQYSPDWYEPYVRALEGSKAIPPSVEKLDAKVTRGEMAEMLWRLTEKVTSEPSKAYINVKYPEVHVNLALDTPQRAESCADLRAFTEEAQRSGYGGGMVKMLGAPVAMPMMRGMAEDSMAPASAGARESETGYSQTNVQVAGVDEGDIVKTDGTYLYAVQNQKVYIAQVQPASAMKRVSTIDFTAENLSVQDLYLEDDRLVVIGSRWQAYPMMMEKRLMAPEMIWPGPIPYSPPKVEARIYDVSDRGKPELSRTVTLDGSMVSSRRIGNRLYLVVNQPYYWGGPIPLKSAHENDVLPRFSDSSEGGTEKPVARCSDVVILPHVPSPQYLTVAVIPLNDDDAEVQREVVLGNAENLYVSLENLYVATTEWIYHWDIRNPGSTEKTNIYRFEFTDDGIAMAAQGSVPGHILNQFSMDEYDRSFRIATTKQQDWQTGAPMTNNLTVLNLDLKETGKIEDIAPGEQIYSVRFLGDRTYMVTFRTIDPLFVIDTSNPRNPKILGKLKIPGFSNYLHPYDQHHILGFGKEAVESKDGSFAWQQGMKIALFDVSDVENPRELHRVVIGDRGTDSPLLFDHKALLFEKDRDLLAFPVSVYALTAEQKRGDPDSAYGSPVFQGAYVYELTPQDGFKLRGTITHYTEEERRKADNVFYGYGKDVQRILRVGDGLITLSPARIERHGLDSLGQQGALAIESQPY